MMTNVAAADVIRRTSTPDYQDFQRRVYATTREEEMAIVDWSAEQKQSFLDMQFRAQDTYYHTQFPNAQYDILERNGEPIGRLYTDLWPTELRILDIALLPQFRNMGIGTALIKAQMQEAATAGVPLTLHVETFNPARRLYDRLGFTEVQVDGIYILMTWSP